MVRKRIHARVDEGIVKINQLDVIDILPKPERVALRASCTHVQDPFLYALTTPK